MGQVGKCEGRGFIFSMEKNYQNALTIVISSEILSSYLSWFCLTDVAFEFICLIFKRIHTESYYDKICMSLSVFSQQRYLFTAFHKALQQTTS